MNTTIIKDFIAIECYKCGTFFYVTSEFNSNRLKDKGSFFCPNGHSQADVESTAEKLKKDLDKVWRENSELRMKEIESRRKL